MTTSPVISSCFNRRAAIRSSVFRWLSRVPSASFVAFSRSSSASLVAVWRIGLLPKRAASLFLNASAVPKGMRVSKDM